ncbi:hypothetical protein CHRY9390_02701 [Chryseobacterium aquaeductus]|uniref:Peptidase M56 domain-containing protein n=1 Tax=Chryseobacterium aquaeductus TaxID=2675056 RepID=A0A9N8MIG0_9FLAO|nr:M56 family metallopeptidase [Chryseobacterium aquaeductus]CAA7331980.1 hypothetical protein CHRY9390_02701 [Chryseobacterium potabilaquae]CAD7813725.1 hypothetical protein CHRY9390_02701 [Chryseobacterium aquaeductus]
METLILYFGKVIICSGVMFLYYQLSLKDKTFHHYNRFYLLSAMLISILLPLIKVEDFTIEVSNDIYLLLSKLQNLNTNKTTDYDYFYFRIIFSALGLVSIYFLGKLLYGIFKINQFKRQFQKESFEGVNFYQTNLSEAPFSYFRNLFWKNSIIINSDVGKQILKHEMVHIEQKHSYDKIFIEIITAVFWFNPFFHIIKKEINLIHEYLADKKAVKQSDTKAFAQMLLASHFSGNQLPATSPFLSSNLKKRLKMLQKPQTKFGYARRIFALPVLFTLAFAYMVNAKNKEIAETNIEIAKAVSEIKKDTISPKNSIDQLVERQESKISKANEQLKIQSEKLKTLSEQSKEKATELKKIAKEKGEKSYEFELKAKELKQLSSEMDKVIDKDLAYQFDFENIENLRSKLLTEHPKFKVEKLELKRVFPDGDNYTIKIDDKSENLMDLLDIKDLNIKLDLDKKKLEEILAKVKSPEFRESIKKIKESQGVNNFNDSEELKKLATEISANDYVFLNRSNSNSKMNLSKKEQRKLERLSKEREEVEKKLKEIRKEQRALQGNPWIINVDAHAKPGVKIIGTATYTDSDKLNKKAVATAKSYQIDGFKNIVKSDFDDNVKIFINGKPVSKNEMDKLDPKNIVSMNVKKSTTNFKDSGEIYIVTK